MPNVGDPAPLFAGVDIFTNTPFSLADHKGQVVVIAFHGVTYCPPCQQVGVPALQELWTDELEADPEVQVVVVSVNEDNDEGAIDNALDALGITASTPWLVDPAIPDLYEVGGAAPYYFIIDADGLICQIHPGLYGSDIPSQKQGVEAAIEGCSPGDSRSVLDRYWVAVATILFGVTTDAGGIVISGGKPKPVPPWDPLHLAPAKRDILVGLAATELARLLSHEGSRGVVERSGLGAIEAATRELAAEARAAGEGRSSETAY